MSSRTLYAQHPVTKDIPISPRFSPTIFYHDANSVLVQVLLNSTLFYSSNNRLYAQNPIFEIVREESMNVYLHMHNGNVEQNPQCVESCVINPVFEIVQESVKVCTTGMSSRILFARHPITKNLHICSPVLAYDFLSRCKSSTPTSTPRLYAQNPVFEIVRGEREGLCTHVQRECSAEPSF